MIRTVSKGHFMDAFRECGRDSAWSYDGLLALYNYLEEYEYSTGENVELDVIALDCEFCEFDSAMDCIESQGYDSPAYNESTALQWLHYNTTVIEFDGGIIVGEF